jgi:uncharacterized protein (DUF433 family)
VNEVITVRDRFRSGKAYTIEQAAHLADISPGTIRNWLYGAKMPDGYKMSPVFGPKAKPPDGLAVSFLELSELIIAAQFRKRKIKLPRIREARNFAVQETGLAYPFAHLDLDSVGGHILARFEEIYPRAGGEPSFVVLSSPGQYVLPGIVQEQIKRFEYDDDDHFASRWHPYGVGVPVVVDPHYAGGRPTIAGSNVSVDIIRKRWKAGEKVAYIAHDFQLRRADVEAVLQHVA